MSTSPDTDFLNRVLGPDSPAVSRAIQRLESIYSDSNSHAPVANSYRSWVAAHPLDADTSTEVFIRHTCLSLLCRLLAYRFLQGRPSERELWDAVSGEYFASAGLGNFLGEDLFSWPFFRLSMGIGDDALSMETAKGLAAALDSLDPYQPSIETLSGLYREFRGLPPSRSPADSSVEWERHQILNCIAPYCGDGGTLALGVREALARRLSKGQIPPEALLALSGQFLGMTPDPLAASVASLSFVMALGEEVLEPHPPILIPVYMAHGSHTPTQGIDHDGRTVYTIDSAGGVALPERVATDPVYLDWLLSRLPNYLRGAALRLRAQPEEVAVQEVLNAWYNYLTSPKARTPIPDPLSPEDADVMVEAAKNLILQYVRGSGPGPLHLVRNAPAPLFASAREFDTMLWPTELSSDTWLKQVCAESYLSDGGQVIVA